MQGLFLFIDQLYLTITMRYTISLLLLFAFLAQPSIAQIPAESVAIPANMMPEFKADPHQPSSPASQISGVLRAIYQDKSGKIWFGGQEGIQCYNGTALIYYDLKDEYGSNFTVKCITEDKQGNIWFGHTSGITKYDCTNFTHYTQKDGLVNNDVWSLLVDSKGTIWIGTIAGASHFDGKTFTDFPLPDAKPDPTRGVSSAQIVHCIMEDTEGNIWFGNNGGAYRYDGITLENFSEADGLCSNKVKRIIEDKHGNIWFATTHNGVCKFNGSSFTQIQTGTEVGSIIEDKAGNIWFSVKGEGIYRYDGTNFTNYDQEKGVIMCLYQDHADRIWASGFGGAVRLQGDQFVNITRDGPW